ncbi:DUF3540 domain-containing protein [Chromobacterium haemolyticum]|uniref:DUF3540 domain-containing protein n=1 Tax=Chromobacterium haemolyticum TaxID=394935 RepID=UPI000305DD4E|nr:DUF3540 domain-containing protein [Chromobacterium haemolyticum]
MKLLQDDRAQQPQAALETDAVLQWLSVPAPRAKTEARPLGLRQGRVETTERGECRVLLASGAALDARIAFSCQPRPQRGDLVQLAASDEGCWVLAILERGEPMTYCVLDFGAASVQVHAGELHLLAEGELSLQGRQLNSQAEQIGTRAQERQTHISGSDLAQCGSRLLQVERHLGLHAASTALSSASLLKLDAGQIHLG